MIILSATCFAYVFRSLGGDYIVEELIEKAGLGSWGLLFLLMGMTFLLGFFLDWVEITLIVLPLFAPILATLDFGTHLDPTMVIPWVAVLIAVNLQTSFLTPPMAMSAYYLKGVQKTNVELLDIFRGIMPFLAIVIFAMFLMYMFPAIALWLPETLFAN